ncbi:MAG: hypothetical protein WBF35_14065 [Candidatus Acidiferrales bacterium]
MNKRFLIIFCASLTLLGGARLAAAQDSTSQDPLADAARKAQAEKKGEPRPTKVYTDDNIGSVQGQISVVGPGAEAADKPSADDKSSDKAKGTAEKKDETYYKTKFADLRAKLAADQQKLDDLQHAYGIKQQQYYADPNTAMKEGYSRKDLNDTSDEIDKKKQDIVDDQQAISDLEDDLRKSGGDAGWAREEAPPASTTSPSPASSPSTAATAPPPTPPEPGEQVAPTETTTPPPTPAPEAPTTPPSE